MGNDYSNLKSIMLDEENFKKDLEWDLILRHVDWLNIIIVRSFFLLATCEN
jgi:hypothetical protein